LALGDGGAHFFGCADENRKITADPATSAHEAPFASDPGFSSALRSPSTPTRLLGLVNYVSRTVDIAEWSG